MSEVKGKPGRKPKSKESLPPKPKFYEEAPAENVQDVVESEPKPYHDKRYSGKCRKFLIHRVPNCSEWAFAGPGTLTPVHVQRGKVIILPEEYFECFRSAGVEVLKCDMDFPAGGSPAYYTEYVTNYPYQDMGEATWEEYLAWKSEDAKKLHPNQAKKR